MTQTLLILVSILRTCSALRCFTCHQVQQRGYTPKHLLGINHLIVQTVKELGYTECEKVEALRECNSTCRVMEWGRATGKRHLAVQLFMCADKDKAAMFERYSPYKEIMSCDDKNGCNDPKSESLAYWHWGNILDTTFNSMLLYFKYSISLLKSRIFIFYHHCCIYCNFNYQINNVQNV